MTHQEIDTLEGRALDAMVAERIMGWSRDCQLPHYSTDIAAAWLVVEKLRELKFHISISPGDHRTDIYGEPNRAWLVYWAMMGEPRYDSAHTYADSITLAICRAALKAVIASGPASLPA